MPNARKSAPSKGRSVNPRISSTGVRKPPRTTSRSEVPAAPVAVQPVTLAPFLASLDWLTLNMDVPATVTGLPLPWQALEPRRWFRECDHERVYWTRPTERRTAQFNRVTEVVDGMERKVCTVWHEPHDSKLHTDAWIQVQFANHTLASGEWSVLLGMLRAMGCTLRGISRVDIACDGLEGDGGDFPKVIDLTRNGNVRYYGKCDWIVRHARGKTIGGEFGHRGSNKFIRAYRKCREMKAKGVKEHIVKQWEAALGRNPMDTGEKVNRFEVQLKGKEIRRYFPDERGDGAFDFVQSLADPANLVDIFASMAVGMFDFRTTATRARKAEPVTAWDWSRCVKLEPSLSFRATRNHAVTEHTMKTELRAMFRVAVVLSDPNLMELAKRNAESYSFAMGEWYQKKRVVWTQEYGKLCAAGDTRTLEFFAALREPVPEGAPTMTREEWEAFEQWEQLSAAMRDCGPPPPAPFDEMPPDVEDDDHVNPW